VIKRGKALDYPRRRDPGEHRRRHQHHERAGDDAGDGLPGPSFSVQGQPFDEDRNEGGAQYTAEHQIEQHVGHGVGQVEGVGDGRKAEHPRQDQHPKQSGES
jgi:hypothetical protein